MENPQKRLSSHHPPRWGFFLRVFLNRKNTLLAMVVSKLVNL